MSPQADQASRVALVGRGLGEHDVLDDLGDVTDARWARDQIQKGGDAIKLYKEVKAGHSTFMLGKDMSYVDDLMTFLKQYSN